MERFSPKMEIINHIDDLIHKVDIEIEETLKKYNENQVLGELKCLKDENLRIEVDYKFRIEFCESSDENKEQTVDKWSESTKVVDYLNQVRMTTIEEMRNQQKESVENSSRFNSLINAELSKEEKRSELFSEKFYFQVKITTEDIKSCVFNLFTFVTDFYMSQSDIDLLENLINITEMDEELFSSQDYIFDEKMVQIALLYKYFCDNLNNRRFPNHVIHVSKQDVSKIKDINFEYDISAVKLNSSSIDLSNLKRLTIGNSMVWDYIIIDSLSSLENLYLEFNSVKEISFKNLYALKRLSICSDEIINLQRDLFDHMPNIQVLSYHNYCLNFKINSSTKKCDISCMKMNDFNLEILMNKFWSQIEKFNIIKSNMEITEIFIFNDYHFPNLLELDISSCGIINLVKKLFDKLPPIIQKLNINHHSYFHIIDADAFSHLKQLVSLNLSNNCIESLDSKLFSGLTNLEFLNLSINRLKRLDENLFSDLKNLKKLELYYNQLKNLDAKSFVGLENLNELDLSNNQLEIIEHDGFFNLKQLVHLKLVSNSFETLNRRSFSGLINLETLDLSYNTLKRLDENIFSDLKNLKELFLWNNQLETLDAKSFIGLENLKELKLSHNKLEKIDHEAFSPLKQLVSLNLVENNIESLDRRIFLSLINLERLTLYQNKLKRLDEEMFSDLKNLKSLDLNRNHLESLDAKLFVGLENLTFLNLSHNKLEKIDHEAFSPLKQLVSLELGNNNIESLDRRLFSSLINLERLTLYQNKLKRLDEEMFSDLKNLKSLDLNRNQLETLDAKLFVRLENLTFLNLSDNKLSHFDVHILDNLPRIESIILSGNEISNKSELLDILYIEYIDIYI